VEWNGHGWSFPDLEHFADPVQGPVTRLHIDRPGTLRLIGSGDNLRIELIPDTRDHPNTATTGLPLPSELLALPDPHRTQRSAAGRGLTRPYAAGLVLIAMIAAAGVLLNVTHIVPISALLPNTTCESDTTGCNTNTAPAKTQAMAPDTTPDEAPDTAPDEASPPRNPAPVIHTPAPIIHKPAPVIHNPVAAPKPIAPAAPAPAPPTATRPDTTGTDLSNTTPPPSGTVTNPDSTVTKPDGTTSGSAKKKSKKSKKKT
jgi:hypothetical protein